MAILSSHFSIDLPESALREVPIPGFTGPITKKTVGNLATILQTGLCQAESDISANVGNPAVTATVDTLGKGSYTNCYKKSARLTGWSNSGAAFNYEIAWKRLTTD